MSVPVTQTHNMEGYTEENIRKFATEMIGKPVYNGETIVGTVTGSSRPGNGTTVKLYLDMDVGALYDSTKEQNPVKLHFRTIKGEN